MGQSRPSKALDSSTAEALARLRKMRAKLFNRDKASGQRNEELCGYTVGDRITVTTLKGSITDERVDIIVNTTRSNLDLSAGGVSAAILKAAGPGIQEECKNSATTSEPGNIIATSGGSLPATYIFHGIVKQWDGPEGESLENMGQVVEKCLEAAHVLNLESIAFPAIGAGGLHTPPEYCARVLHREVLLFFHRHHRTSVDNVHFVLHPSDENVIQAFVAQNQELVSGEGETDGATSEEKITEPMQGTMTVPVYWKTRDLNSLIPQPIDVQPSEEGYITIKNTLLAGGVRNTIKSITRIENMSLYQEYAVRKTRIQTDCPGATVERMLFHGTTADVTKDININGFSRSYFGTANAAAFGDGVYFAVNPAYSAQQKYSPPDANKIKYIYQCRVLTGVFCKGTSGLKAPPQIPSLPDGVRYDSVADDKVKPTIFVIFRDSQVYPEYLIQLLDTDSESSDSEVVP